MSVSSIRYVLSMRTTSQPPFGILRVSGGLEFLPEVEKEVVKLLLGVTDAFALNKGAGAVLEAKV